MARHIGIVAVSPEGASLAYRQLLRQAARLVSPHEHPTVSLHNEPLAGYLDAVRSDDWHRVGELLRRSAEQLRALGAEIIICPDNAVQHATYLAQVDGAQWLAMPDLVADRVIAAGHKTVGIIGTKMVTGGSTYQTHLGVKGVQVLAPEPEEADRLDEIIFGELIYGRFRLESQRVGVGVIEHLAGRGCDAVILGCSEAPLVVTGENSPLPVFDATDILAEGAVRRAIQPA